MSKTVVNFSISSFWYTLSTAQREYVIGMDPSMLFCLFFFLINNLSKQIKEIIRQGVEVPEGQNDLRRMQLRELALLNGTLRENDGPRCTNCGSSEHKSWMVSDSWNK